MGEVYLFGEMYRSYFSPHTPLQAETLLAEKESVICVKE